MVTPGPDKPRTLVFGRNEGAPYHPLAPIQESLVSLLSPEFEVRVSDRGEQLLALGLDRTDLIVGLDDRWTEPLDRRWLDAVEAWVRRGGSLLLVHNGICWARDPRWRRLAGGRFTGHGPAKDLRFTRKSDGATFDLFEEPYRFSIPWLSGNQVLCEYEDGGRRWPAFWVRSVGKGRIAYALPGHGPDQFRHPTYRQWLADLALSLNRTKYPAG